MQEKSGSDEAEKPEGSRQTIRVRQGITNQGVRYVLAGGLILVVAAFVALAFFTAANT